MPKTESTDFADERDEEMNEPVELYEIYIEGVGKFFLTSHDVEITLIGDIEDDPRIW